MARKRDGRIRFSEKFYECLIWDSNEDGCWIAHSLHTDQIGTGDCVLEALADMMKAVNQTYELYQQEPDIAFLREAPSKVSRLADRAAPVPKEIYEIAHKMVNGDWPNYIKAEFALSRKKLHLNPSEMACM